MADVIVPTSQQYLTITLSAACGRGVANAGRQLQKLPQVLAANFSPNVRKFNPLSMAFAYFQPNVTFSATQMCAYAGFDLLPRHKGRQESVTTPGNLRILAVKPQGGFVVTGFNQVVSGYF
ncbi:MAG: hypothetical protein Fur0021_20140 [Candidatus Promineifilaceae bacterium]